MEVQASPVKKRSALQRTTGLILLLTTAAVFLFSGITKLIDFPPFVWNIMDAGVQNMRLASITARLFIGFELLLGLFLLLHLYLKSFTYPAVQALLALFTIYLILLIVRQGNAGNCGCFGESFVMTPLAAIGKNLVLMAFTFLLKKTYATKPYRQSGVIAGFVTMAALVVPFLVFPLSREDHPEVVSRHIDLSPLYDNATAGNMTPTTDLRKGKHIVSFMSLSCPHCRKAALLLQIIHRQHPNLPLFFVLNGSPDRLKDFYKETRSQDVPHVLFRGAEAFQSMAGDAVPAIYFINNSMVEREATYFQLDPGYMETWYMSKH